MNINKDNYQAFLLDLSEGQLSEKQTEALYAFLNKHPELDSELLLEPVYLSDEEITFPNKAQLNFDSITPENRTFFFVSHVENQLSPAAEKELTHFLATHPIYLQEFQSYLKAVIPKISDSYPNKKRLLTLAKTPVRSLVIRIAGVAAILVFLFLGGMLYTSQHIEERYSMQSEVLEIDVVNIDRKAAPISDINTHITTEKTAQNQSAPQIFKAKDLTRENANTLAYATGESSEGSPNTNNSDESPDRTPKAPRVAMQLETVINALTPSQKEEAPADTIDFAKSTKEPLTVKEFLLAKVQQNSFFSKAPKKQEEFVQLLNKQMKALAGEDQYIAKKEDDAVKTHVSFGGFSFYRSRSIE